MKKLLIPAYLFVCNFAYSAGFGKAKSALTSFQADLLSIVKILAVIALIIIGAMYMKGMTSMKNFLTWSIGAIIVGAASEITSYIL